MSTSLGKGKEKENVKLEEWVEVSKDTRNPYINIPEAQYAPPATRNFGPPQEKPKEKEIAYKTVTPITDNMLLDQVYEKCLKEQKITLSMEEIKLMSRH